VSLSLGDERVLLARKGAPRDGRATEQTAGAATATA
jgi:hypothetical protein